jgi:hypothetical protein
VNRGFHSHVGYLGGSQSYRWGCQGGDCKGPSVADGISPSPPPTHPSPYSLPRLPTTLTTLTTRHPYHPYHPPTHPLHSLLGKHDMWHNETPGLGIVHEISYSTDFYTRYAIQRIQERNTSRPFWLHVAYQGEDKSRA